MTDVTIPIGNEGIKSVDAVVSTGNRHETLAFLEKIFADLESLHLTAQSRADEPESK